MYRRVLLSAVGSVALVSSAFAADIYSPAPVPAYAAVALPPSWGGFYLGVNGGYGGETAIRSTDTVFDVATATPYSDIATKTTIAGGFGGGQLGYNFQWGPLVAGFETDIEGSNIRGSGAGAEINTATAAPFPVGCSTPAAGNLAGVCAARNDLNVDWFGTARGRLGYAFGGTLLYVTGGFAYGGVTASTSWADNYTGAPPGLPAGRASISRTQTGWVAGAGIETKLAPNWTLKGEYQFIDLGSISTGTEPLIIAGVPSSYTLRGRTEDVAFNTVRVGINYLFSAPEPLPLK